MMPTLKKSIDYENRNSSAGTVSPSIKNSWMAIVNNSQSKDQVN